MYTRKKILFVQGQIALRVSPKNVRVPTYFFYRESNYYLFSTRFTLNLRAQRTIWYWFRRFRQRSCTTRVSQIYIILSCYNVFSIYRMHEEQRHKDDPGRKESVCGVNRRTNIVFSGILNVLLRIVCNKNNPYRCVRIFPQNIHNICTCQFIIVYNNTHIRFILRSRGRVCVLCLALFNKSR